MSYSLVPPSARLVVCSVSDASTGTGYHTRRRLASETRQGTKRGRWGWVVPWDNSSVKAARRGWQTGAIRQERCRPMR